MFGLSSVEVQVVLSEDNMMLKWHNVATGGWLSSNEKGVVDLTQVTDVRSENEQSLVLTDSNQTELFNVQAETRGVRDKWVSLLTELLESWSEQLERPAAKLTADGTSDKAEYFRKRNEEVEERAKQRAEMKAKYSGGGMKYSAMALARRGDDS
jgi:hypothetical protein